MAPILDREEIIALRNEYNLALVDRLKEFLVKYPTMRFCQALIVLGYIEDNNEMWNEESIDTYSRVT